MVVRSYQDLVVWTKAMDLAQSVYEMTKTLPREEIYGLASQIRRAVVSVASNIAEGQARDSTREFLHHLSIAYGSLCEVETQLHLAHRFGYLNADSLHLTNPKCQTVGRLSKRPHAIFT